jgi:glycosyl transferase, family 25
MLFLINLDAAIARREHMMAQLEALGVAFERIGIDMRGRTSDEIAAWVEARFPHIRFDFDRLSGPEVGCWLSHLSAWRRLAEGPHSACTVLEDDLVLGAEFAAAIDALGRQHAFDLVYLGTSSHNLSTRRRTRIGRFWAHAPVGVIYNTWGYTMTRKYAQRLFGNASLRIAMPIDHFLGGNAHPLKPRIAVLRPALVDEDPELGVDSQIEPHTFRIDRWRLVERARRRLLSSRVTQLYYSLYRLL